MLTVATLAASRQVMHMHPANVKDPAARLIPRLPDDAAPIPSAGW